MTCICRISRWLSVSPWEFQSPENEEFRQLAPTLYSVVAIVLIALTIWGCSWPSELIGEAGIEFVLIPAGTFMMGSEYEHRFGYDDDERPIHEVTITKPFYISKHEVTQEQWMSVMGGNPSINQECGGDCPVENVSWHDAQEFIRKLNLEQPEPLYRLPTEAEWEYAARAGETSTTYGGIFTPLSEIAWYEDNSDGQIHKVGQREANEFGLHDMLGNVQEWTQDWYGEYSSGSVSNPSGPDSGSERVHRGGSWRLSPFYSRLPYRYGREPGDRRPDIGVRLVRTAP